MKRNIILMSGIVIMIVLVLSSCNSFRNKHIHVEDSVKKVSVDKAYMGTHLAISGKHSLYVYIFYVNIDTYEIYTISDIHLGRYTKRVESIGNLTTEIPAGIYRFLAVSFYDITDTYTRGNRITTTFVRDTRAGISNPSVEAISFPKEFQVNNGEIAYIGSYAISDINQDRATIQMQYVEEPEKINAYISQLEKDASLMKTRDIHAEQSIQE